MFSRLSWEPMDILHITSRPDPVSDQKSRIFAAERLESMRLTIIFLLPLPKLFYKKFYFITLEYDKISIITTSFRCYIDSC